MPSNFSARTQLTVHRHPCRLTLASAPCSVRRQRRRGVCAAAARGDLWLRFLPVDRPCAATHRSLLLSSANRTRPNCVFRRTWPTISGTWPVWAVGQNGDKNLPKW